MNRLSSLSLSLSLVLVPLAACTGGERSSSGQCPAGEICSPATPMGLHFIGRPVADELFSNSFGPLATAIGGTQEIELEYDPGDGRRIALDLPYEADDDGGLGVTVAAVNGPVVTVRGVASRTNYLRIVEPGTDELYDRHELAGAAISSMRLVGTELERLPTARPEIVWATGDQEVAVALVGEVQDGNAPELQRLVDTSMELSLPGATRVGWDTLRVANGLAGVHTLNVTAGDKPTASLTVEFVTGADAIELLGDAPTIVAGSSATVCFAAFNADRYVYGLTWEFNVDGEASTHGKDASMRNCIHVEAPATASGTTIPVAAAAGGQQMSIQVVVGASARTNTEAAPTTGTRLRSTTTAGDRAAAME